MDPYFGDDNYDEDEFYDYDEVDYGHSDFEYDDLYDDVGDDYDYDAWHLSCSCRLFHEVLDSYAPSSKSVDNISHIDVFNISHHFTNLVEVIEVEYELQWIGLNIIKEFAEKADKMAQKMKHCLEEQLKNVLKLPNTVVIKILEFLLDYSISSYEWDVIKFEENNDQGYRRILSNAHDYFLGIVQIIRLRIEDYSCDDNLDIPDLANEVVSLVNHMEEEDKEDWQNYFGIKLQVKTSRKEFDFWEDIDELEDALGGMFDEE